MGFTNVWGIIHEKWDEEGIRLHKLMEDTHYSSQRLFIPTNSKSYSSATTTTSKYKKNGKHHHINHHDNHHFVHNDRTYHTHDEEILERLILLQD
ncbi:MAG: hypothetical protein ACI90V_009473 [Bacillariaceae sp.]|jgi:hypothetical protein